MNIFIIMSSFYHRPTTSVLLWCLKERLQLHHVFFIHHNANLGLYRPLVFLLKEKVLNLLQMKQSANIAMNAIFIYQTICECSTSSTQGRELPCLQCKSTQFLHIGVMNLQCKCSKCCKLQSSIPVNARKPAGHQRSPNQNQPSRQQCHGLPPLCYAFSLQFFNQRMPTLQFAEVLK